MSLLLYWPMNFSIIFSPCVMLRKGSERVSGWALSGGSQPRSMHQARLSHQQGYNRKEDAVNIGFYIIKAFLCRWSLSRSSDFNLISVYWALKISFPLILFSQLSISTAEQTRLSAFGIDFCLTSATVQQCLYCHIIMVVSSCAYILDFHVYIWKETTDNPPEIVSSLDLWFLKNTTLSSLQNTQPHAAEQHA